MNASEVLLFCLQMLAVRQPKTLVLSTAEEPENKGVHAKA